MTTALDLTASETAEFIIAAVQNAAYATESATREAQRAVAALTQPDGLTLNNACVAAVALTDAHTAMAALRSAIRYIDGDSDIAALLPKADAVTAAAALAQPAKGFSDAALANVDLAFGTAARWASVKQAARIAANPRLAG